MDTVSQDILFKIGTVGTGAANKNVAAFTAKIVAAGAAIALLSKGIGSVIESAQKFGQVFRANSVDMELFNRDTAGLIDTTLALTKAVEFQEAGIRLTAEQMRALGVAAADYAQNTGKSVDNAFSLLTKSVITARETGLLPFGIELSQTADKGKATAEALDKLIEKTRGIKLETESSEEAVARFNNTLGTIRDLEVDAFLNAMERAFSSLGAEVLGGIENMEAYEGTIHATNGAILEWQWTQDGMINSMQRHAGVVAELVGTAGGGAVGGLMGSLIESNWLLGDSIESANQEYERQIQLMTAKAKLIRELEGERESLQKKQQSQAAYLRWTEDYSAAHSKLADSLKGTREDQLRAKKEFDRVLAKQPLLPAAFAEAGIETVVPELDREFFEPRLKKKARGGPRPSDMEFSEEEIAEFNRLLATPRLPDFATGAGEVGARGQFAAVTGAGAGAGAMAAREKAAAEQRKEMFNAEIVAFEGKEQEKLEIRKYFLGEEQRLEELNAAEKVKLYETSTGMMGQFLGNLSAAQDKQSKDGFERQKALDYAQNVTQTTLGATSAITGAFRTLPFPVAAVAGPAMAASIVAKGVARGQQIRSQKFGGGRGVSGDTGLSTPSVGDADGGGTDTNITLNVMLSGQKLHNEMVRVNELESQSGNKSFTTAEG